MPYVGRTCAPGSARSRRSLMDGARAAEQLRITSWEGVRKCEKVGEGIRRWEKV